MEISRRRKTIAVIIALSALCGSVYNLYSQGEFHELERKHALQDMELFDKVQDMKSLPLKTFAEGYASWDDMARFVKAPSRAWPNFNLAPALKAFDADAVWVFSKESKLLYTACKDGMYASFPLSVSALSRLSANRRSSHFFCMTPLGLMEFRGAHIRPANDIDNTFPSHGYFIVGKVWSKDFIGELSWFTKSTIAILPSGKSEYTVGDKDADQIAFMRVLGGWDGTPAAQVLVADASDLIGQLEGASERQLGLIVAGVFLCFTLLAVYISRHQCEQARGTEREKAQLLEVLESSNRDLQDFAYIASHDLQAPLRKIIAFGGLLEDSAKGKLDGEDLEDIENMMGSARHMQRLINDLLTYSRIATQGKPLEPVALDEVVGGVVSLSMGQLLSECGGRVEVAGPLPWVMADPMQIHQLLQNLIENGFKYRKEGEAPVVTVRAVMRDGGKVCVEVQDNGMGIDAKYHESIFKMFHRLHSNDKIPGTGIGLAVCERIVKRFGGSIGVKSEPGAGSVFWFTMDCAPARGLEKAS